MLRLVTVNTNSIAISRWTPEMTLLDIAEFFLSEIIGFLSSLMCPMLWWAGGASALANLGLFAIGIFFSSIGLKVFTAGKLGVLQRSVLHGQ